MERHSDRGRDRQTEERSSIHWFSPQVASMTGSRPVRNQEPGTSLGSPICMTGFTIVGSSLTAFLVTVAGCWTGKRRVRILIVAHMACSQSSQQLNLLATVLIPCVHSLLHCFILFLSLIIKANFLS